MNISYKQSQFELFPGNNKKDSTEEPNQPKRYLSRKIFLSIENLVILLIVCIMGMIFSFSAGVERGKKLAGTGENQGKILDASVEKVPETQVVKAPEPVVEPKQEVAEVAQQIQDGYTIQVASFREQANAKREAATLQAKGFDAFVLPKGSHQIVCVGRFGERQEARQFGQTIGNRYKDFLVRRL